MQRLLILRAWRTFLGIWLILFLLLIPAAQAAPTKDAVQAAVARGLAYLKSVQNSDGGFPAQPGGKSDGLVTAWVVLALRAQGEDPCGPNWSQGGNTPLTFLLNDAETWKATTDYARITLAVLAAGGDPHQVNGHNLPELIALRQRPDGSFGTEAEEGLINATVWSVLALKAAQGTVPREAAVKTWLLNQQNEDGGFAYASGLPSDVDNTAAAIQALVALGERGKPLSRALAFLRQARVENGAWAGFTSGANVASAAWGLQALAAAGEDPASPPWTVNGVGPVSYVLSLQEEDGCFAYTPGVRSQPVWMTAQALLGLSGLPFPLAAGFRDVLPGTPLAQAVHKLLLRRAVSGYGDFAFHPEDSLTRAQFAKMLVMALAEEGVGAAGSGIQPAFGDVPEWAMPYVNTAAARGWLKGVAPGRFDPNAPVTGAQVATVLLRATGRVTQEPETIPWYAGYVAAAQEAGLLWDGFDPLAPATRAQCAQALAAIIP